MKPRFALVVVPVLAAIAANAAAYALWKAGSGSGPDGVQWVLYVSSWMTVVVAIGVAGRHIWAGESTVDGIWLGVAAGALSFVLSWAPTLVNVALNPPS